MTVPTKLRLRLPATSANLGPGFDALGLAMGLYLTIDATVAPAFHIKATGRNADLCARLVAAARRQAGAGPARGALRGGRVDFGAGAMRAAAEGGADPSLLYTGHGARPRVAPLGRRSTKRSKSAPLPL